MRIAPFFTLAALLGCAHRNADPLGDLQTLTTISLPTDSAVLVRLGREHPCVTRVPRLSRFSETLSRPVTCTLVETSAAAIRDLTGAPEILPDLRQFRVERVLCVTVRQEAYRNDLTGAIESAHWTIEFESDAQPVVAVEIHRRTGDARAYKTLKEFDASAEDICE
jgi:hypothetical protein